MKKLLALLSSIRQFFSKKDDDRSFSEKMRDNYRLVLLNEDNYREVGSWSLTPLNVYAFFSSIIVATALFVTLLIMYTPLKRYIPGYGDLARTKELADLKSRVRDMEQVVKANEAYNENLRSIMNGDVVALSKAEAAINPDSQSVDINSMMADVERSPEDDKLRAAVATEAGISSTTKKPENQGANAPSSQQYVPETPLEKTFFMTPLSGGDITSAFDMEKDHLGIDVSGVKNAAIRATHDGVVVSAGFTVETGHSIAIQHKDNMITIYKHNSVLLKKAGSQVKQGEAIAIIGNTGEQSTGPHLHFEIWYRGRPVNPADYINFQ
jgi:murein DD-endopeptidase MepM/ murein hydrolase activator NlpD